MNEETFEQRTKKRLEELQKGFVKKKMNGVLWLQDIPQVQMCYRICHVKTISFLEFEYSRASLE